MARNELFSSRLRAAVGERVHAQEAAVFNVDPSGFSRWLHGTRQPNLDTVRKMAKRYKVSTDWLLGLVPDQKGHKGAFGVPQIPLTEPCDSTAHEVLAAYTKQLMRDNERLVSALSDKLPSGLPTDWLGTFVRMVSQHATESAKAPDSGGDHLGGTTEEGRPGAGPQEKDRGGGPGRARRR